MPTRREVVGSAAAALALASFLPACSDADALPPLPEGAVRVPLVDLPEGTAVTIIRVDEPVEVRRSATTVLARSLFCPHFGCRLSWVKEKDRYQCPCHGGAFDAEGRPIAGPPTEPMRVLRATVQGDYVVVEKRKVETTTR